MASGLTRIDDGRLVDVGMHNAITEPACILGIEAIVSADAATIRRTVAALELAAETITKLSRALAAKLPDDTTRGN